MMPKILSKHILLGLPLLMLAVPSWAERSGFYSIMGPDGHVIVIDRNAADPTRLALPKQAEKTPTQSVPVEKKAQPVPHVAISKGSAVESVVSQPVSVHTQRMPQAEKVANTAQSSPSLSSHDATQPVAIPLPAALQTPPAASTPNNSTTQIPVAEKAAAVTAVLNDDVPAQKYNPIAMVDGEAYVDSEYLEQKEFNLEGKKRFYNVPDGLGGDQLIQREKGIDMSVFHGPKIDIPNVVTLSKNYQRIPAEDIVGLTGVQCFSAKQLAKTKVLSAGKVTNLWPRPSFEPKFDFVVTELVQPISDIELTSYANSSKKPVFYWPLPIYLDKDGCVLEGVSTFYSQTIAANMKQHQAIQGYLHIPDGAKYLLLTPLEAAVDVGQLQLTNQGQIRLTPIR